jgi:hypothetical protein
MVENTGVFLANSALIDELSMMIVTKSNFDL